jgi:hypothetical protein
MTIKPMTYLLSFTAFVILFMALGGYVGYVKIADHFLTQSFLDATPLEARVQADAQGPLQRWEGQVSLPTGGTATILTTSRDSRIAFVYSDAAPGTQDLTLAPQERMEDLRLDQAHRYVYVRVLAPAQVKSMEQITWIYKYDLQRRHLVRRTAVSPILLPAVFRP